MGGILAVVKAYVMGEHECWLGTCSKQPGTQETQLIGVPPAPQEKIYALWRTFYTTKEGCLS